MLNNPNDRQLRWSEQQKPLLSQYSQVTAQKGESRDYTRLKKMVVQYLEQNIREKRFSSRERQLEKPASGAAAANGKSKGKRKRPGADCVQWTTTHQCSRGDKCGMKHEEA